MTAGHEARRFLLSARQSAQRWARWVAGYRMRVTSIQFFAPVDAVHR